MIDGGDGDIDMHELFFCPTHAKYMYSLMMVD
jgi:hypothetical protein